MFSIFKNKKEESTDQGNTFFDVENSVFNTEDTPNSFEDNTNFSEFIGPHSDNVEIPKYKAKRNEDIGIVIDKDQIGFDINTMNKNIKTVELETSNEEEIIDLGVDPISVDTINKVPELNLDKVIEEIIPKKDEKVVKKYDEKEDVKLTLFGSGDVEKNKKQYTESDHLEEKLELIGEVKFTKDGYKICPDCGAILNFDAPVCFMCSKSFVLKK